MTIYRLGDDPNFPPAEEAEPSGLLAVGGDLSPRRLLTAYAQGIFPWPLIDEPLLWFSPDPRAVLMPRALRISRSLRKRIRRQSLAVGFDGAFAEVVRCCAEIERPDGEGTWITPALASAYQRLHELGFAHSVEARREGRLVGGLYGVALGGCFFGESMFTREADASKLAFVRLVQQLEVWGFSLIDCQVHTHHLERFGAELWPRPRFLRALASALELPTRRGSWCDASSAPRSAVGDEGAGGAGP